MPSYVIGDIQGCFTPFRKLLDQINFEPSIDILWLSGDLVNRGPESLEVLRFVKNLGSQHRIVLGNHDLHLLARSVGAHDGFAGDTLDKVLRAEDKGELMHWLKNLPLLQYDASSNYVMTHAGIAPMWDIATAKARSLEVERVLRGDQAQFFLHKLYGDKPNLWSDELEGIDRLRCITNYFTRMRYCNYNGSLILSDSEQGIPWFKLIRRKEPNIKILFGHWAQLNGVTNVKNIYALDTGCVWGYCLTAMCLETLERFSVACTKK